MSDLYASIAPTALKWVVGLVLTGLAGLFMYPFRRARKEWSALKAEQSKIHDELVTQRTNCLHSIQLQGATQIELLGKTVAALDGIRLDLADQTGFLRAMTAQPPRVRKIRAKK